MPIGSASGPRSRGNDAGKPVIDRRRPCLNPGCRDGFAHAHMRRNRCQYLDQPDHTFGCFTGHHCTKRNRRGRSASQRNKQASIMDRTQPDIGR